jgi:hypothetical protein
MPLATKRSSQPPRVTWAAIVGRAALATLFVIGLTVPALSQPTSVAAQASTISFSTAEVAPADSFVYMVATTDQDSEQLRLADVLLDRAGLGEAIDQEIANELRDEAGEELPLDAILGGEVAVVVTQAALDTIAEESMMGTADMDAMMESMGLATPEPETGEPEPQGVAIILDAPAPDTAWTAIQDAASEDAAEETTYEGTTILYAPPSSSEEEGMAAAQVGEFIALAASPADLHAIIDTADGRTPAITTLPEFATAQAALPGEYLMFAFVDDSAVGDTDFGMLQPANMLTTQSFSAATVSATEAGFRMETVAFPVEGATLPPGPANFSSELVNMAPPDTIFFSSGADLGATGVLDAIGAIFLGFAFGMAGDPMATPSPDASPEEALAAQYESAAAMLGINLQTEFFQQLTGEYGGWLTADLESETVSGLFASGTEDPQRVADALLQLSFLIQGATGGESMLTTREVGGGQVYVIELGDEAGSTLEFGVVNDNFVIGKGDAVDRFGAGPEDSLAGNEQFQAVMDTLPVEHNGLFYIDLTQAIPVFEVASEQSEAFDMGGFEEFPDASESCANYATQEEAQAAYDAAEPDTFDLDQDFDGEVCEDFFAVEVETPEADDESAAEDDPFANVDYSAIKAFASVSYSDEEGLARSSAILYISE